MLQIASNCSRFLISGPKKKLEFLTFPTSSLLNEDPYFNPSLVAPDISPSSNSFLAIVPDIFGRSLHELAVVHQRAFAAGFREACSQICHIRSSLAAGMADSEDAGNWSDTYELEISSQQSYQGLPSFILETMSDYSVPSPGMLSDDLRAYADECQEELELLSESPGSARAARLQAIANKQRGRIEEAELDIAAYNQHQTVAENTNSALADRLAGITTAHVLVCLERDGLRRFRMIAIYVIVVLVMLLLGFLVYVHRILHP